MWRSVSGTVNEFRRVVDVKKLLAIFENFRTGDMFQHVVKSDVDLFIENNLKKEDRR